METTANSVNPSPPDAPAIDIEAEAVNIIGWWLSHNLALSVSQGQVQRMAANVVRNLQSSIARQTLLDAANAQRPREGLAGPVEAPRTETIWHHVFAPEVRAELRRMARHIAEDPDGSLIWYAGVFETPLIEDVAPATIEPKEVKAGDLVRVVEVVEGEVTRVEDGYFYVVAHGDFHEYPLPDRSTVRRLTVERVARHWLVGDVITLADGRRGMRCGPTDWTVVGSHGQLYYLTEAEVEAVGYTTQIRGGVPA